MTVVELYAGLKAGLRGRRIGCGAPQRHLGRELRFNSESEILLNTSESSLGILTLVSYVQRDLYATVPGKTFVGGAGAHGQSGVLGGLYYNTFQNFVNPPCASIL